MPTVDLLGPRQMLESAMVDTCLITVDAEQVDDDLLDQITGELVRPVADRVKVWAGRCLFTARQTQSDPTGGGSPARLVEYSLMVPISCPELRLGMEAQVTRCAWDPRLTGKTFVVDQPTYATYSVARRATVLLRG